MAVLNVQQVGPAGDSLTPSFGACAGGGDTFANDGNVMLYVKNGHSSPQSVTVGAANKCDQGSLHDSVTSVPNASEEMIGPFPVSRFGSNPAITYSGVTLLTIAVIRLPS